MDNIGNPNPKDGAGNSAQQTPSGGGQTGQSNDFDPIMADIDAAFGDVLDPSSSGGTANGMDFMGGNIDGKSGQQQAQDETVGMNAQELAAFFQSKYDKAQAELSRVKPEYERYKSVADFVNQVYEDPVVKQAFLAEVAPDVFKPADPYDALQEQLKKEFGEDFTPDDDEASKPLSKTWRYYKRVDELYSDITSKRNSAVPKTLKELRESRKAQQEAQAREAEAEKADIMRELNWTESDWQDLLGWVPQLKTKHLAKWRQGMRRKSKGNSAPNLVNQFGGHSVNNKPGVISELDKFFG